MVYLGLFLVEFFILFFTSRFLIQVLGRLFYSLTKSRTVTVNLLTFLFLPGTIVHELSHAVSAGVLFVEVGHIEFIPQIDEEGVRLGSAQIGRTDAIRRSLIGIAPVLIGLSIIIGSMYIFDNILLQFLIIFEVSNTMFSSKKDLEGIFVVLIILASIIFGVYILGYREPFIWFFDFIDESGEFIKKMDIFLAIPIVINLLIIGILRLLRLRSVPVRSG